MPDDMLNSGGYPDSFGESGPLKEVAQYLPLIASALSMFAPELGGQLKSGMFAPGGMSPGHHSNPRSMLLDAQGARALGAADRETAATKDFRKAYGWDPSKLKSDQRLTGALGMMAMEAVHDPRRFSQYHTSALMRTGVGYDPKAKGTGVDAVFKSLGAQNWTEGGGTPMHERGLVAAMLHKTSRGAFQNLEGDALDAQTQQTTAAVTELTKGLSELARVMGTDVKGAAGQLSSIMGMDAVAAFHGNAGALTQLAFLQTETTRATGVSQAQIASQMGGARSFLEMFGGPRGTMGAPVAGIVGSFFGGAQNAYGLDTGRFDAEAVDTTAAAQASRSSRRISGIYDMIRQSRGDLSHAEFAQMVQETGLSDPKAIAKKLNVDMSVKQMDLYSNSQTAEMYRMQSPEHAALMTDLNLKKAEQGMRTSFGKLVKGGNFESYLGVLREGGTEHEAVTAALVGMEDPGERQAAYDGFRRYKLGMEDEDRKLKREAGTTEQLVANREKAKNVANAVSRAKKRSESMRKMGGFAGMAAEMGRVGAHDLSFSNLAAAFMGVENTPDAMAKLGLVKVEDKEKFIENMKRVASLSPEDAAVIDRQLNEGAANEAGMDDGERAALVAFRKDLAGGPPAGATDEEAKKWTTEMARRSKIVSGDKEEKKNRQREAATNALKGKLGGPLETSSIVFNKKGGALALAGSALLGGVGLIAGAYIGDMIWGEETREGALAAAEAKQSKKFLAGLKKAGVGEDDTNAQIRMAAALEANLDPETLGKYNRITGTFEGEGSSSAAITDRAVEMGGTDPSGRDPMTMLMDMVQELIAHIMGGNLKVGIGW